jgi:hypothetical protein
LRAFAVQAVGDRDAAGPDPDVVSHEPAVEADLHPVQVSAHIDHPPDRGRLHGVVAGVQADVVVAPEPDSFPPAQARRDRRQRQHPGTVVLDQVGRAALDRADLAGVRPD